MSEEKKKKFFEIDIKELDDMQDLIYEYFLIVIDLLDRDDLDIEKITFSMDSTKILVEADEIKADDPEPDEEDSDWEWL